MNEPSKSPQQKTDHWFRDMVRHGGKFYLVPGCIAMLVLVVILMFSCSGCRPASASGEVVVYAAQDQIFAEEILKGFEKQTGVRVRTVFDSEAVKTVGIANRLLAEREHPQCDVFWGNEELRTRQLAAQGIFRDQDGWRAFGQRSRRLVINTKHVQATDAPKSLLELTNANWHGKVALAYPLFGTTATHFLALRQRWGEAGWLAWCRALQANKPFVVDGNSVVVKLVAQGEACVGLTDSDDIAAAKGDGLPVDAVGFSESLAIPNTVGVVRGAPHAATAQQLLDYLCQPEVAQRLVEVHALEGIKAPEVAQQPDWKILLNDLEPATAQLREVFLR